MKIAALLVVAVGACGFAKLPKLGGGDDAPIADAPADTSAPDAGACVSASTTCASSDTLRTCSAAGATAVDTTCSWGCLATGTAHCGLLQPTGGGATGSDADTTTMTQLADVTIPAGVAISGADGTIGGIRGSGIGVISGIDYNVSSTGVAVFRMKSLRIAGTVVLVGSHPIVLIGDTGITVAGVLDARGCGQPVSPGGFPGGPTNGPGAGPGGGSHATGNGGAGGAGYGAAGGNGGLNQATGGVTYGDDVVTMLVGGSGGGGGGNGGATGGNGGGAVQLITNGTLLISTGAGINAGGCGGRGPNANSGGGGAGAGGTIVLEGKTVTIQGALAVNGGAGGGGGNGGGPGGDATLDRNPAVPGQSSQSAVGGPGGVGSFPNGLGGQGTLFGGGGGGGIGRIRVNTQTNAFGTTGSTVLSPAPNDASSTFTSGVARVQ